MGAHKEHRMDKKARNAAVRFLGAPRNAKVRRFAAMPKWMDRWPGMVLGAIVLVGLAMRVWEYFQKS